MSMGYMGTYIDSVDTAFVRTQCTREYDKFQKAIDDDGDWDFHSVACVIGSGGDDLPEPIERAFIALCTKFTQKTKLTLSLGYHDPQDDGDRDDEVEGAYWEVAGVWQLTPSGKKYQKYITRKTFVVFG